jgi:hypothetical protein
MQGKQKMTQRQGLMALLLKLALFVMALLLLIRMKVEDENQTKAHKNECRHLHQLYQ